MPGIFLPIILHTAGVVAESPIDIMKYWEVCVQNTVSYRSQNDPTLYSIYTILKRSVQAR